MLIRNATIVWFDRPSEIGDILIEGGKIAQVGRNLAHTGGRIIDGTGKVAFPALIQGHLHLCQTFSRGWAEDLPLLDWLERRIVPLELAHSYETMFHSARLGIAELIRSGVSAVLDMGSFHHQSALFDAAHGLGIRLFSGMAMADNVELWSSAARLPSRDEQIRQVEDALSRLSGTKCEYVLCPRFLLGVTPSFWREIVDFARVHGLKIHTHASENRLETELFAQKFGYGNVEALFELGALSENVFVAHCVHLGEREFELLSSSGAKVLHCPTANLKLGSGIADVVRMRAGGIGVLIGSDGAGCNNRYDIWGDLRLAALLQRVKYGATALSARDVLAFATVDSARFLGINAGELVAGKEADVILLDLDRLYTAAPLCEDIFARILYGASVESVDTVVIGGEVLVEGGELRGSDVIIAEALAHGRELGMRLRGI